MGKNYEPVEVFSIRRFIKQNRHLKCIYFEFDTTNEHITKNLKETVIYFDLMIEFMKREEDHNQTEQELYYYIPIKFVIHSQSNINKTQIREVATKKMFEIRSNFEYCLKNGVDELIIQNRIVKITI